MGRETSLVLAIEPDSSRAEALRQLVRERLGVELVLVSSPYAAIVALNRQLPELILFSSSLSDRNQNKVVAHYRSLTDGIDPQTLIIPLLRDPAEDKQNSRFSFKWKRQAQGENSDVFLEMIANYLRHAEEAADASATEPGDESADDSTFDADAAVSDGATAFASAVTAGPFDTSFPEIRIDAQAPQPTTDYSAWGPPPAPVDELMEIGEEVLLDLSPVADEEMTDVEDTITETTEPELAETSPAHMDAGRSWRMPEGTAIHSSVEIDDPDVAPATAEAAINHRVQVAADISPVEVPSADAVLSASPTDVTLSDISLSDVSSSDALQSDTWQPERLFSDALPSDAALSEAMLPEALLPDVPPSDVSLSDMRLSGLPSDSFPQITFPPVAPPVAAPSIAATSDIWSSEIASSGATADGPLDILSSDPSLFEQASSAFETEPMAADDLQLAASIESSDIEDRTPAMPLGMERSSWDDDAGGDIIDDTAAESAFDLPPAFAIGAMPDGDAMTDMGLVTNTEAVTRVETVPGMLLDGSAILDADTMFDDVTPDIEAAPEIVQDTSPLVDLNASLSTLFDEVHVDPGSMIVEAADPELLDDESEESVDLSALIDTPAAETAAHDPGIDPEVHAAEIALIKLEAEQKLATELERLRLEAVQQREAELARLHVEAEALRHSTVARAREAAEIEAREALSAELARVRVEAEQTVSEALSRVKSEAEQTLASEVIRAREEAEQERQAQLAAMQAELERARLEAEQARQAQLAQAQAAEERADEVARQAREAAEQVAQQRAAQLSWLQEETEALRQDAVARARAEVETEAREALAAELARARSEAEQTLNDALSRVRSEAEATLSNEVNLAREQAERARSEELARLQAMFDERVSEAARLARETAESEASRTFTEELARARAQAQYTFASELARAKSEAQLVVAESERARADAFEQREVDVARAQAEAETLRQTAIVEARTAAEHAAARALEREVDRVKREAETRVQQEVERLRAEADRARSERSEAAIEAEKVRETARELEQEIARVRAVSAEQLEAELTRVRLDAERAREVERATARQEAERLREAAARDARAVAEAALKAELEHVRAESEARLAAEVTQLRAEAERHRSSELAELRHQLSQVRDAAAQQAQKAAADAVAAEVARANKERAAATPKPTRPSQTTYAPPTVTTTEKRAFSIPQTHQRPSAAAQVPASPSHQPLQAEPAERPRDIWTAPPPPPPPAPATASRWRVPALAACLLIAAGTASYNWLPWRGHGTDSTAAAPPAEAPPPAPPPAPPVLRMGGEVRLDSTPSGATVIVDGQERGQAPVSVADLTVGNHTVVFEANGMSINRTVRVRADEPVSIVQDMTAGFLSIFSRIPVEIRVDGRPTTANDNGQLLVAPGLHTVTIENKRFNFRQEFPVTIKPGDTTPYTVMLPMGALRVTTEPGSEVWVEGERVGVAPLGPIAVPIGTREVLVKHPEGESRQSVEIVYAKQAELTLKAPVTSGPPAGVVRMPPLNGPASGPPIRR